MSDEPKPAEQQDEDLELSSHEKRLLDLMVAAVHIALRQISAAQHAAIEEAKRAAAQKSLIDLSCSMKKN
jgi:hypothetical protein